MRLRITLKEEVLPMRNKPRDIKYCNVDKSKIKHAEPIIDIGVFRTLILGYIKHRSEVHLKKDIQGLPAPWTKDLVISNNRFTNVRRELDKQTRWLIENIATNENLSYNEKVVNTILFRLFSKYETLEIVGAPFKFEEFDLTKVEEIITNHISSNPEYKWFTTSFFTNGIKKGLGIAYDKCEHPIRVIKFINDLIGGTVSLYEVYTAPTQYNCYEYLRSLPAMGDFIAYQVFVDLTYIEEFPYSENEFTIAGVGCKKGLDYLFKNKAELNYDELLFWLRDNIQTLCLLKFDLDLQKKLQVWFSDIPEEDRYLNLMCLENCMCELGKYMDIIKNQGRPRPKYKII